MAELSGLSLQQHLEIITDEYSYHKTIYGYPVRNFYQGYSGFDFSADLFGKTVCTPLGPAAGPHTQLAQNIVLSFLHGSRIIELKTIQKLDQLEIPRPCIDIRNIGYNVEWSQELSLGESLREYVNAWIIIHLMKDLDIFPADTPAPFFDTIFDISVGYDLAGISSPQISGWIEQIKNGRDQIQKALSSLRGSCEKYKNAAIPSCISDSVTLSTFHGCPGGEIESIVEHLIKVHQLNVVVKMNPTLLGYDFVSDLLHNKLGYKNIVLDKNAFESDLNLEQAVAMMKRLQKFAKNYGKTVGAKFTNTLVTKNTEKFFNEQQRYLSGAPLYVLAMHSMFRFREAIGPSFPVSFSGGINKNNFSEAVSCNIIPVTTCTDLLKKGGYSRLSAYLKHLKSEMDKLGVRDLSSFIKKAADLKTDQSPYEACQFNASRIIQNATRSPVYHFTENSAVPKKINSQLDLFDCLSCNICLPVCPNVANFEILSGKVDESIVDYRWQDDQFVAIAADPFVLRKETQIANIADFCNECGNCETFCPEDGGPQNLKARFFLNFERFSESEAGDGFYFESGNNLYGRINGINYQLILRDDESIYEWHCAEAILRFDSHNQLTGFTRLISLDSGKIIKTNAYHIMKLFLDTMRQQRTRYPATLLLGH